MKTVLTIAILIGFLIAAILVARTVWTGMSGVTMSTNGIVALVLGVVVSLALGGGLMFLVFYSSRKGHDDPGGE